MALILSATTHSGPIHLFNEDTGQEILVEVVSVRGQQAKLSFTADKNISIQRDVVYQREQEGGNQ